jgi:hypothetical protein
MILEEYDHLMGLSIAPQDIIATYSDADALNDRIQEWIETPEGTLADLPGWGHKLGVLQHEPPSSNLEVMMEFRIVKKLASDCGVPIYGVRVDFRDIDICRVQILYKGGIFNRGVNIRNVI